MFRFIPLTFLRLQQSLLTDREAVAAEIEAIVEDVAARWGISIESILIKDIVFSQELQQSLSSGAQQKRIGEAKIISARAEVDAAQLMRKAADILSSPAAMQIRSVCPSAFSLRLQHASDSCSL